MARVRKLFPIYGSALANNMLKALARERVVARFVARYIDEYDRHGITGGPARDRELAETIGREVILAMVIEIPKGLPKFFGKTQRGRFTIDEKQAMDAFFQECIAALGRAWNWKPEDRRLFHQDFTLYSEFDTRKAAQENAGKKGKTPQEEPPFVGRVALLLDPSMLEQARRASRKFHAEVERLAQNLLKETLRPARN
ncbi:MAG: hypothetical protein LAO19_11490 [Acidobacteriia bacterium]|nr:hypothetical protein [Terriglobia bacterium]